MAFSQPTDEAQTPAVCQLCEESPDIRWKCINCDVFMCQLCTTKIHTKLKSTDKHELINLKDFGSEAVAKAIRKVDLQNMPCTVHNDQMCCAFCTDCDQPICMDCVIQSHEKHKFRKLNEVYESTFSEIKDLQNKLESSQSFFGNEKERLEKLLLDGDKNYQEIKDKILETERKITETVSKYAKELLKELELTWKPTENKIKTDLYVTQKTKKDLIARKESLKKSLQSHQASEIFSLRKKLDKNLPKNSVESINYDIFKTKFISGNISKELNSILRIFGDLYAVPDFELVKSYQSDFSNVQDILNCDDNTAFIGSFSARKLQKVKFEENNIKVEEDFKNVNVRNMTRLKNEEILLATGESDLKVYTKDKQFKSYKSFSPLKTISVTVSQNNEIFVGLAECYPVTHPATKDSARRVVVINEDGDIQHIYEYDKDNQKLFTEPRRIITLNDNLYILDRVNIQWEGRIVVLDYGGQLLWTYNGCNINLDTGKFCPTDITASSSSTLLISDPDNQAIHILNSTGEVIACKDIKPLGIELPLSLDFDENGILLIGCNTFGTDKEKNAKFFSVKLV